MGGFLLYKKDSNQVFPEPALKVFEQRKQKIFKEINYGNYKLITFSKRSFSNQNLFCYDEGFAALTGTTIYKKLTGEKAASALLMDFKKRGNPDFADFQGHFCFIIGMEGKIYLSNDFNGIYHIYHDEEFNFISNSFLAVSKGIRRGNLNCQGLYEYVFLGSTFDSSTIADNIIRLDNKKIYQLTPFPSAVNKNLNYSVETKNLKFGELLEINSANLKDYFKTVAENFRSMTLGLSGGFDSRLALSLLLENNVKPYIYTNGLPDSMEVNIARTICRAYNLEFENYYEKDEHDFEPDGYKELLNSKFISDDGFNMFGIFYSTVSKDVEISRIGELNINGMGGEIFRVIWKLPDREMNIKNFIKAIYLQNFPYEIPTGKFDKEIFFENLGKKVLSSIGLTDNKKPLSVYDMNLIAPSYKGRYKSGTTCSKLNQLGYSLLPFLDPVIYLKGIEIPSAYRIAGKFQSELLKKINPELARFRSNYLFNFYDGPDVKSRMVEWTRVKSPLFMRKTTPSYIKYLLRSKRENIPANLMLTMKRGQLIFNNKLQINEYLNPDRINSQDMYSRILTLEYYINNW